MDTTSVLVIILVLAAIAVCSLALVALFQLTSTLRSARRLIDDLDERLVPLIENAEVTVDALNAELLRVDGIVTRFEEVSDTVSSATNVVRDAANAPLGAVNVVGSRLRKFVRDLRR